MSYTRLFVLIFAIIAIHKVQSELNFGSGDCNSETCNDVCNNFSMDGTCVRNECRCSTNKKCIDVACDAVCSVVDLDGECDENDLCICKAELELCWPTECLEGCIEHQPPGCLWVYADFCMKYGPIQTCHCVCVTWFNQFIHFGQGKAKRLSSKYSFSKKFVSKKSSELNRNYYRVVAGS